MQERKKDKVLMGCMIILIASCIYSIGSFVYNTIMYFSYLGNLLRFSIFTIVQVFALWAYILAIKTNFVKTRLVKVMAVYALFQSLGSTVFWLFYIQKQLLENFSVLILIALVLNFLIPICNAIVLSKLVKYTAIQTHNTGINQTAEFYPADKSKRIINYLIDTAVVLIVCISTISSLTTILHYGHFDRSFFYVTIFFWFMLYYLVFEGIFGATAGKFATNTKVVNAYGQKPSFGQLLGRTLTRRIPFEPFSFLGADYRGWHDTASNTYVVDVVDIEAVDELILDAERDQETA